MNQTIEEIKTLLYKFEKGYKARDQSRIQPFLDEIFSSDPDSLIVGTGQAEWMEGPEKIKQLVENDWKEWTNLSLDIENAHIHTESSTAWVTTTGICDVAINSQGLIQYSMNLIKNTLDDTEKTSSEKLENLLPLIAKVLHEERQGDIFKYPLRVSIVLKKMDANWKIHQMHFSFPNLFIPDGRITT